MLGTIMEAFGTLGELHNAPIAINALVLDYLSASSSVLTCMDEPFSAFTSSFTSLTAPGCRRPQRALCSTSSRRSLGKCT